MSIKFGAGERQFLCLLQAHCLWQSSVGVCALCLSFAVSSTRLGRQLPNLGVRVSVSWPLTYLAQGLNSFHCFYPWGPGKAHMEKLAVVDSPPPSTHELGDVRSQWPQLSSLVGTPGLPCGANIAPPPISTTLVLVPQTVESGSSWDMIPTCAISVVSVYYGVLGSSFKKD